MNSISKNFNSNSASGTCDSSPYSNNLNTKEIQNLRKLRETKKPYSLLITNILEEITFDNEAKKSELMKNCFYMKNLPNLSFSDFIKRIYKYLKPENSTIIISLIYIDVFLNTNKKNLFLTENNIFKIYLASIVLAIKYNEDNYNDNNYFAKVGGVTLGEMNLLEMEFLKIIDYRLFIYEELFFLYEENFMECDRLSE